MIARSRWFWTFWIGLLLLTSMPARSADYEIFDGRTYNGKYYPRVDIIEWGQPSHMEFQVYWKGKPLEMSFELEDKGARKVMLVHYFIKERNEHLCRRVLAPGHFHEGFMVYKDTSDKDMDNTIVTVSALPAKKGLELVSPPKYFACETAEPTRLPAAEEKKQAAGADHADIAPPAVDQKRTVPDKGALKKKDQVVPFGDW